MVAPVIHLLILTGTKLGMLLHDSILAASRPHTFRIHDNLSISQLSHVSRPESSSLASPVDVQSLVFCLSLL